MTVTIGNPLYYSDANRNFPSEPEEGAGEVCIPNISPEERKKRERFAIGYLIFTLGVLGLLVLLGVDPLWRLPLVFMFSASTTSFFQSLDKT